MITQPQHPALTAGFNAVDENTTPQQWQMAATCKGLLEGYHTRWLAAHQSIKPIEIEKTYVSPLMNLETTRTSRTFRLAGKVDKLVCDDGRLAIYDHKTTSQDITDPDAPYWRQLTIEGQPMHYELLLFANGLRIERTVWDVIRKPGIRPKKLTAAERKVVTSLGEYCKRRVSNDTKQLMINEERENGELYQIRLAEECKSEPDRYFARRSVVHLKEELADYAQELWDVSQEVRLARKSKRHYRNSGACMLYGSPCKFLGICSGHDTPDSNRWQPKQQLHHELDEIADGLDVITNSRIRCFQTCRRKHFYDYELGIERLDEEEKEALVFGSLFHTMLDAWWISVSQEYGYGYCSSESPVNAVGNSNSQRLVG